MLTQPEIIAFIPTLNPSLSKSFYRNTLGLSLISTDKYGLQLAGKGSSLRIATVREFAPYPFTVLGFKVQDIKNEVIELSQHGVIFEIYDSLNQDEIGIWTAPSGVMVAWFKDPDGNLLSLTQHA